ncbi:MAG: hypothetical protein WAS51_07845 [Ilumatobacteraceae bacterium]
MSAGDVQVITLSLPLDLRHASTARMVASSLGADAGFSVDDIDDLRLGINEVFSVLAEDPADGAPNDARLTVDFRVRPGFVEATMTRTDGAGAARFDDLAERILETVVDSYELLDHGGCRLRKSGGRSDDRDG